MGMTEEFADPDIPLPVRRTSGYRTKGQKRRAKARRAIERANGTHGARYFGCAGPDELVDPWTSRTVPPWEDE